jgi:hypothetical protein
MVCHRVTAPSSSLSLQFPTPIPRGPTCTTYSGREQPRTEGSGAVTKLRTEFEAKVVTGWRRYSGCTFAGGVGILYYGRRLAPRTLFSADHHRLTSANGLNRSTRTSLGVKRVFVFLLAKRLFGFWMGLVEDVALKLRCDREQTAHLQTVLLHLSVRTQIRTAQPGSIRATWLGTIAAAYGLSSSPAAGLTCQMHLREHVLGGGNVLGYRVDRLLWFVVILRPRSWPACAVPLRPFGRQTAWPAA